VIVKGVSGVKNQTHALIEFSLIGNVLGKLALSRWSRVDAQLLNYLAVLTSRHELPDAERLRDTK